LQRILFFSGKRVRFAKRIRLATAFGVWLLVVQHTYERAYWRDEEGWDYFAAGVLGSSHLELPAVLRWFTANIGLHHLHHLDSHIPNYRLQECLDENPQLQAAHRLTIGDGIRCLRLTLRDAKRGVMVAFGDLAGSGNNRRIELTEPA
jgi:omega-6 fatty acid desaturase (delta-12 desaturase)